MTSTSINPLYTNESSRLVRYHEPWMPLFIPPKGLRSIRTASANSAKFRILADFPRMGLRLEFPKKYVVHVTSVTDDYFYLRKQFKL